MKKLIVLACLAVSAISSASLLEGFEHGNPGLYTEFNIGGSNNLALTGGAAHDGSLGASFAGSSANWFYRTDLGTSAGNTYSAFVRFTEAGRQVLCWNWCFGRGSLVHGGS